MAVNSITFGGVNSADFGIYISGEGVFNAPKRDVEMITIPGRNGAFALDNGRFENIEVTYPAFNFEPDDYDTFMQNLSDFRNAICSQRGYQRLTDTFHPDEYRMATYIGGLEIKPVKYNTASEFNIVFDCKPQRWLVSGETAVTVDSGDTLTNPTLFEASPLLEVTGYGTIGFNDYEISFEGIPYGEVLLCRRHGEILPLTDVWTENLLSSGLAHLMTGDFIYPSGPADKRLEVVGRLRTSSGRFTNGRVVSTSNVLEAKIEYDNDRGDGMYRFYMYIYPDLSSGFNYGTPKTITSTAVFGYSIGSTNYTETLTVSITYNGSNTITIGLSMSGTLPAGTERLKYICNGPILYGFSTEPLQGIPISIDCDLGEAYIVENGVYRSLNQYIDLGSELPKLASGSNTVTFDNTITDLKITPRWWKV